MATDELNLLGQQVVDTIVSTYLPSGGDDLALAFHPGQAIADDVVQTGVTNPLVLSQWIADQYDYPMLLRIADGTRVPSPIGTITAKDGYVAMVPWATPTVPAESAAYPRVAALIASARQSLGNTSDTLPFGCEPGDFAEPTSTGWQVFDSIVSATTTESSTTPASTEPPIRANPELWRMRSLPEAVVLELPQRVAAQQAHLVRMRQLIRAQEVPPESVSLIEQPATDADTPDGTGRSRTVWKSRLADSLQPRAMSGLRDAVMVSRGSDTVNVTLDPSLLAVRDVSVTGRSRISAGVLRPVENVTVAPAHSDRLILSDALATGVLRVEVAEQLAAVQIDDLVQAPSVSQTTTESSSLHVHFEYQLLQITKRLSGSRWWRDDLVTDPDWCVPAMHRGDVFDAPEGEVTLCLPRALIVVRDVSITGQWSAEARESLRSGITYIGPFLASSPSEQDHAAAAGTQFSVLGTGIQVIGELCTRLPSLPPRDDPALVAP